jgi:hypothetical protein
MRARSLVDGASFVGSLAGAVYATQMAGVFVHEIVGHGLVAEAVGGTFRSFAVHPSAHGHASFVGVDDRVRWIPMWGGIAVQLVIGVAAVLVARARRGRADHRQLASIAIGVTNAGSAVGYALQGLLSGAGDAWRLHESLVGVPRYALAAALLAGYLLVLDVTLRLVLPLLDAQAGPPTSRARRRSWFLATIALPVGALLVTRPASTVFSPAVDWASRAAIFAMLLALGAWRTRTEPLGAPAERPPFRPGAAAAWLAAAVAIGAVAAVWTTHGVAVR